MHILEVPSIPREKKQLQALIAEARHRQRVRTWTRWAICAMLLVTLVLGVSQCQGQPEAAPLEANNQGLLFLPIVGG
jgi:type VI protein secretion system component VasF